MAIINGEIAGGGGWLTGWINIISIVMNGLHSGRVFARSQVNLGHLLYVWGELSIFWAYKNIFFQISTGEQCMSSSCLLSGSTVLLPMLQWQGLFFFVCVFFRGCSSSETESEAGDLLDQQFEELNNKLNSVTDPTGFLRMVSRNNLFNR